MSYFKIYQDIEFFLLEKENIKIQKNFQSIPTHIGHFVSIFYSYRYFNSIRYQVKVSILIFRYHILRTNVLRLSMRLSINKIKMQVVIKLLLLHNISIIIII